MTPARIAAAAAAIGTALLLQATLIGPASGAVPVSLPAVLVACVGLVNGPATGISLGFAAGLVADLGSTHPAGVLALCWLLVGLASGTFADRHNVPRDSAATAVICTGAGVLATALLALTHSGTTVGSAITGLLPCLFGDFLLALLLLPLVRRMLGTDRLRPPRPVARDLLVEARRG
jgi:rod shape-determining protein MreD